jgi:hypothetical protein
MAVIRHIDHYNYDTPIADLMPGQYGVSEAGHYYIRCNETVRRLDGPAPSYGSRQQAEFNGHDSDWRTVMVKVLGPGTVITITVE